MIKANELRVGNLISIVEDPINYKDAHVVTGILIDNSIIIHNGDVDVDEYYPIPLTPEILENCGEFMNTPPSLIWYGNFEGCQNICIDIKHNEVSIGGEDSVTSAQTWFINNFKYLHQLQNLYFALTGQELPVTL